jgi:hypothetical protein
MVLSANFRYRLASMATSNLRSFGMALFALPALLTFCVVMPVFCEWQGLGNFSQGFGVMALGVLPVITFMISAWLLMPKRSRFLADCTVWDWHSITVLVTVGHWVLFMGAMMISLFVLPGAIMDQVAGAFFYYMVPLVGIEWVALALSMMVMQGVYRAVVMPAREYQPSQPIRWYAKPMVLAVWPASFVIYAGFQFVFYHFVPG